MRLCQSQAGHSREPSAIPSSTLSLISTEIFFQYSCFLLRHCGKVKLSTNKESTMKHKICLFILLAAVISVNAEESTAEQAPIQSEPQRSDPYIFDPYPRMSAWFSPSRIDRGHASLLRWSGNLTTSCEADYGYGYTSLPAKGKILVRPQTDLSVAVRCRTQSGRTLLRHASIVVIQPTTTPLSVAVPHIPYLSQISHTVFTGSTHEVSWSMPSISPQVSRYELQRKVGSGNWSSTYSGTDTSYSVSGVTAGRYSYRIRACSSSGCSSYSQESKVRVTQPTSIPEPITRLYGPSNPERTGSFSISWYANYPRDAERYELFERIGTGNWSSIYSGIGTRHAISSKANGTYSYRVRACNGAGCSTFSPEREVTVALPSSPTSAPNAPSSLSGPGVRSAYIHDHYDLSWSRVEPDNATRYELDERRGFGNWSSLYSGPRSFYKVTDRSNGLYSYRVRACNSVGCSSYTTRQFEVSIPVPQAPSDLWGLSADENGDYIVSWEPSSYDYFSWWNRYVGFRYGTVSRYELYERVGTGSWIKVYSGLNTSFQASGKTAGNTYSYRVKSCNRSGCSGYTSIRQVVVPAADPIPCRPLLQGALSQTDTDGDYTVSWGACAGRVSRYELEQSRNNGSWTTIYSNTQPTFSISATANGSYRYRVRACSNGGCSSWSGLQSISVAVLAPSVPTLTVPSTTARTGYNITWVSSTTPITRYELEERQGSGAWSTIYSGARSTKTLGYSSRTGTSGIYNYRLRACNAGGCSAYTAVKRVIVTTEADYPQEYHFLDTRANGESPNVYALSDQTKVVIKGVFRNLNMGQKAPAATMNQGAVIYSNLPLSIGSDKEGTDMPVPGEFAGRRFVIPLQRGTHRIFIKNPNFYSSSFRFRYGSTTRTERVPANSILELSVSSNAGSATIDNTTGNLLVGHRADTTKDVYAVPPATRELLGIRSRYGYVGTMSNSTSINALTQATAPHHSLTLMPRVRG